VGLHRLSGALPPRVGSLHPYSYPRYTREFGDTFTYPPLVGSYSRLIIVIYACYWRVCYNRRAVSPYHRYEVL